MATQERATKGETATVYYHFPGDCVFVLARKAPSTEETRGWDDR